MPPPTPSASTHLHFPSSHLTLGGGVAIFHLASARVVVCRHSREGHYFLPKGRRDVGEASPRGAEREGFEESGYRCRVLPLPFAQRQTRPPGWKEGAAGGRGGVKGGLEEVERACTTEAIWMELLPLSRSTQYVLFWYVAETVPEAVERMYAEGGELGGKGYVPPPEYPKGLALRARMEMDDVREKDGTRMLYVPVRHEGTGVDEDELQYESYLLSIEEACKRLRGTVMEGVVRRAWEAIQERMKMEAALTTT